MMQTAVQYPALKILHRIREHVGVIDTPGLTDDEILAFLEHDTSLAKAIEEGGKRFEQLCDEFGNAYKNSNETDLIVQLQEGFVNFYNPATVNPYVAMAARGPWVITSHGAVVHDNGGYGMLGAGPGPQEII